jgi:hypothetical protein
MGAYGHVVRENRMLMPVFGFWSHLTAFIALITLPINKEGASFAKKTKH